MKRKLFLPIRTLPSRIFLSIKAIAKLLYFKPTYLIMAIAISIVFYEIIFWMLNIGLFQYMMLSSDVSLYDKFMVIVGSYSGIFGAPISPLAITLFVVSILQGVAVSALVYSIKHERSINKSILKDVGGTGVAGALAVMGLGCAACGTSLVTPILTFLFATSSVAVAEQVGLYSAILALIVSIVTVYLAGYKLSSRLTIESTKV